MKAGLLGTILSFGLIVVSMGQDAIRAVNMYGLETDLKDVSCSWVHPAEYYIDLVKSMGFNTIRLPFSAQYINDNDFSVMDRIVKKASSVDLTLILDYHRTWTSHQGDFWETNVADYWAVWDRVLTRYYDYPFVGYIDLYNEFQQSNELATYWNELMTNTITHLEMKFPSRFNWVVGGTNWGGSLNGIKIDLPYDNIYYTIHKYQFSLSGSDYKKDYDISFGNIPPERIIVGEFGWIDPDQRPWALMFLDYLKSKGVRNTAFWCLTYFSGDTQGLLKADCNTIETEKLDILQHFWGNTRQLESLDDFLEKSLQKNMDFPIPSNWTDYDYDPSRYKFKYDGSTGYLRGNCP